MRAAVVLSATAAFALAACEHPAAVVVDDASATRTPDGHVQVEILVTGVEQSSKKIGSYCVSAHWFGAIDPNFTDPAPAYYGELDSVIQCFSGIGDGDRRSVLLTSNKTGADLTPGTPIRCQVAAADVIRTMDIANP